MKTTVPNGIGIIGMGLLLVLPSETPHPVPVEQGILSPLFSEYVLAQCGAGRTVGTRGPLDQFIPYVVEPRNTAVASDRPDLRWNNVPGVNRYTVRVMNGEAVLWTQDVNTNRLAYPAQANPLQPGIDYTVVVQAANGRASTEEDVVPSFQVLSPDNVASVEQAETLFSTQPATETSVLLKADFYTGSELYGKAIATLETAIATGTQSAIVNRRLGDLYARSSLNIRAELYYQDAIALAADNLEEKARAQASLGELYVAIEQEQEAIKYFTQAKENYEQLNNQLKVKEMQEQIANLSSQSQ